ncbi:MAG: ATP-dependent DNA helicase [Chloroflexi bacterium]|nr:ATP-dependent DNA helicase [Chloroflexota bacterium]
MGRCEDPGALPGGAAAGGREAPPLDGYRRELRRRFGYPELREGQARVLSLLGDADVLAVMPTGSGKSLCYVLPSLATGRTLVVSPLIALMQDQVEGLQSAGVPATAINSQLSRGEKNRRYRDFVEGRSPLLYVAPEQFRNAALVAGLRRAGIALLAVDEAHCISEWGHNFRPDYLQLGEVRERLGSPRTLALTATANPRVRRDIRERLGLADRAREVVTSVDRPNLLLSVEPLAGVRARREWVLDYARSRPGQAGIVYARTRRGVEELASHLREGGVGAAAYHAGLAREERTRVQRAFTLGETPVIVATTAFGMGIDKPDVRFVVHLNMPGRLESYFQEAGRAGRDGEPAECTLLYARFDRRAQQGFIDEAHPEPAAVSELWRRWVALAGPDGLLPADAEPEGEAGYAMTVVALRESGLLDPVSLRLTSTDPDAPIETSAIVANRAYAEARLAEMVEYAETGECRRAVILRYFGESPAERCDGCDSCLRGGPPAYPDDLFRELLALRERISAEAGREPDRVFERRTAREIAAARPRSERELLAVWGMGERTVRWFGARLLDVVSGWEASHPEAPPRAALERAGPVRPGGPVSAGPSVAADDPVLLALRAWRRERARSESVPAYTIFADRTLRELAFRRPADTRELLTVWGLGDSRVRRFGQDLLRVIRDTPGTP